MVKTGKVVYDPEERMQYDLNMMIIRAFIKETTGREIKLVSIADVTSSNKATDTPEAGPPPGQGAPPEAEEAPEQGGWGLRYQHHESHREHEETTFSAEGVVRTADGREIRIDVELGMSRRFASDLNVDITMGAALKDPLVVNFNGSAAQLTQTKYQFDIDNDGMDDQISFVGPDSGFLALDKNGDGLVNNGAELFGTASGDGFEDLSRYDSDGNRWIDETDPIYSRLQIWSKDAEGNDSLVALGVQGIGAIYLGNTTTPFAIKDGENRLLGEVRASGIYLHEDGRAGTVQQVDLVV
ncbi:MAG: hypothetical protein GY731_18860 [Gammaproteobacteria bacterium]|nr:hypothetical protein [Gammaproteobacteria bacterium]